MQGRIKRRLAEDPGAARHRAPEGPPRCPLCERPIPASQLDAHHLIPKSRGGVHTAALHRICHRQVHALLTEAELARAFHTIEALRAHPELARFIRWVRGKPDAFFERTRKRVRVRGG